MSEARLRLPRVIETANGAQLLPPIKDEHATINAYISRLACDADLRTKAAPYREVAARMTVVLDDEGETR